MIPFTGKDKQGRYFYRGVRWMSGDPPGLTVRGA